MSPVQEKNKHGMLDMRYCLECHRAAALADSEYEKHDKITEATLKPVTKVKSELDRELQEWGSRINEGRPGFTRQLELLQL